MKRLIYLLPLVITLFSCEDVVDLDIIEGPKRLIVDGGVHNNPGPYQLKLTYSQDYNSTSDFPVANGVIAVIIENDNFRDTLVEIGNGLYQTDKLTQSTIGNTYKLYLKTPDGREYESTTEELLQPVALDTFRYALLDTLLNFGVTEDEDRPGEKVYLPYYEYKDPAGVNNFYRYNLYVNGENKTVGGDIRIRSDRFNNGQFVEDEIRTNTFDTDAVKLDFISISEDRFNFLDAFRDVASGGGGPFDTPIAPVVGNVFEIGSTTSYALGYFQVYSYNSYDVIIKGN